MKDVSMPMATATSAAQGDISLYTGNEYLSRTAGTWHLEDSPFKARHVARLVERNNLAPRRVCEIGCGAGGILAALGDAWGADVDLTGYEISPAAHALSQRFARPNLRFILGDAFTSPECYDLAMVMDVIEHVEDCFAFLRRTRDKASYKVYHIPLEITCTTALRDGLDRGYVVGHIHHFSTSTALAALRYTGHRVVDWLYTPVGLECGKLLRTRLINPVRRLLPTSWAARLVGGYSLLALTE